MQGKNFNIENVEYLAPEDKITLRAFQKIKKGEKVNIDDLPLDELSKQALKEFKLQNNSSSNYFTKCKNCGKNYEVAVNPPRCHYCQSRNIETFKNGVLQPLLSDSDTSSGSPDKKDDNAFDSLAF
jgi:hypothetical protein